MYLFSFCCPSFAAHLQRIDVHLEVEAAIGGRRSQQHRDEALIEAAAGDARPAAGAVVELVERLDQRHVARARVLDGALHHLVALRRHQNALTAFVPKDLLLLISRQTGCKRVIEHVLANLQRTGPEGALVQIVGGRQHDQHGQ